MLGCRVTTGAHDLRKSGAALLVLLALALVVSGCTGIRRVLAFKEQVAAARAKSRILGRVDTESASEGALVVVLGQPFEEDGESGIKGVDSYVRGRPGTFLFIVDPGTYQIGAYEDRNQDGLLGPDERVARIADSPVYDVAPGETLHIELLLQDDSPLGEALERPLDVLAIVERDLQEQQRFSLWAFSRMGTLCEDLMDPRFGPEAGLRGLWEAMDFLNEELAGIYFIEPYDDDRIPVLFVHGMTGYPQEFRSLIEQLDRSRFQPWFYFYPSGFALDGISRHLAQLLQELQVQHGFDELAVVAHSMGGLVSRGAIVNYAEETHRDDVGLFISISTPWGGDIAAAESEQAPISLPASFKDLAPGSDYLRSAIYEDPERTTLRRLPRGVEYHMIFGFGGSGSGCGDGSVTCSSQARPEVQEQALSVRAWNYGHTGILHEKATVNRVNRLLDERF